MTDFLHALAGALHGAGRPAPPRPRPGPASATAAAHGHDDDAGDRPPGQQEPPAEVRTDRVVTHGADVQSTSSRGAADHGARDRPDEEPGGEDLRAPEEPPGEVPDGRDTVQPHPRPSTDTDASDTSDGRAAATARPGEQAPTAQGPATAPAAVDRESAPDDEAAVAARARPDEPAPSTAHDPVAALLADLAASTGAHRADDRPGQERATDDAEEPDRHVAADAPAPDGRHPHEASVAATSTEGSGPTLHIGAIEVVVEAPRPAQAMAPPTPGPSSVGARRHLRRA